MELLLCFLSTYEKSGYFLLIVLNNNMPDRDQRWHQWWLEFDESNPVLISVSVLVSVFSQRALSYSYLVIVPVRRKPFCYKSRVIGYWILKISEFFHHGQMWNGKEEQCRVRPVQSLVRCLWVRFEACAVMQRCPIVRHKMTRCQPLSHLTLLAKRLLASPLMSFPDHSLTFLFPSFPRWLSILHSHCSFSLLCSWGLQCG